MDQEEKRMAGSYEIIQTMHIGVREVVLGEDLSASVGERFMCGFCEKNDLFALYDEVMVSDDYAEIVKLFGERVASQAEKTMKELSALGLSEADLRTITKEAYQPVYYEDDLHNKVVVIRPDALRREYQQAPYQLRLCTGGFGASPKSRGSACFCQSLITGQTSRFERLDIAGIIPEANLPQWAKDGLHRIQQQNKERKEAR